MLGHALNVLQSVRAFALSLLQVSTWFMYCNITQYIIGLQTTSGVMETKPGMSVQ